jgi:hypothetical protein
MAHVRFSRDFDWSPRPRVIIAYKAGEKPLVVRRACADAAIAAGAATEVEPHRRDGSDGDDD